MLTEFSKWLMYISSYLLLYILLIIKSVGLYPVKGKSYLNHVIDKINENILFIGIMLLLIITSIIWIIYISKMQPNIRKKGKMNGNCTLEMIGYIIPYAVSMITIDIDRFGIVINVGLFIIIGIALVYSEKLYLNPTLLLFRYKVYKFDSSYLISRSKAEEIKLILTEDDNGVEIREISPNLYIHNKTT